MVRFVALAFAVLVLVLAFLMWETAVAGIPASLSTQLVFLKTLPAGAWPIIALFAVSLFLFGLALGPDLLQKWGKVISDRCHRRDREMKELRAENQRLKGQTWQSAQPTDHPQETDSVAMEEWSRRFDTEVRQKFLNRYMDEAEGLRAENEELRRGLATPEEGSTSTANVRDNAFAEARRIAEEIVGETDNEEDLKRRCRELADELRQFLEDNESLDEEQTMRLYNRRLGDKASALLEELEEHSLYPPPNQKSYQLAANAKPLSPFAIRNLAGTLGTIGHRS